MNKAEAVVGAVVTALGIAILVGAANFPYFVEGVPGPGFLPRWISFGIIGTGLVLTAQAFRHSLVPAQEIAWPNATGWRRVALMVGAMAVSLLLLEILGFVVTTALFMVVVVFCLGVRSWRTLVLVPPLSAIGLYAIFALWLRVPLPKGILAFFD